MRMVREELAILSVEAGDHVLESRYREGPIFWQEREDSLNFIG